MRGQTLGIAAVGLAGLLAASAALGDDKEDARFRAGAKKGLASATITLKEAVQLALRKIPNSREVEAELEVDGDDIDYYVEVIAGGKHQVVEIDAVAGEVEAIEDEADEEEDYKKIEEEAQRAKVTLLRAIDIAAARIEHGKMFEAAPDKVDGHLIYYFQLLQRDKFFEVSVDAATGKVLAAEEVEDK